MTLAAVINNVRKLAEPDVRAQIASLRGHLDVLLSGSTGAVTSWVSLADAANMAETLADMRIGGGEQADAAIAEAQEALAYLHQQRQARGTWALSAEDRIEVRQRLDLLVRLHELQLKACSYGEFVRAFDRTAERVRQAAAGNAAPGVTVLRGEIA